MSDSSEAAIFKICAQLQKEINDLKSDGDSHYIGIEDLAKKIDGLSDAVTSRLESELDFDDRVTNLENMIKAIFNLLSK